MKGEVVWALTAAHLVSQQSPSKEATVCGGLVVHHTEGRSLVPFPFTSSFPCEAQRTGPRAESRSRHESNLSHAGHHLRSEVLW